jgi:spermidine/putrescine-binding protein
MKKSMRVSVLCVVIFVGISLLSTSGPTAAFAASKEMIAAAIKEGEVSWLDAIVVPSSAKAIAEAFKKEYGLPDSFKVNHERLASGPIATRVAEEVKANRVTIDLFAAPVPTLYFDLKEYGALLRYDCPEYKNYSRATKVGLFNEPGYWQSAIAQVFAPVTNPKIFPKKIASWNDLLSPDLAGGKITLWRCTSRRLPLTAEARWMPPSN